MSDIPRGIAYPLYARVKREMALQGWTATRLRKESGIARSTLAKWEKQPRPPLASTVISVADALGLDRLTTLRLAGILNDAPPEVPDMTIGQRREVLGHPERVHASEERRRA